MVEVVGFGMSREEWFAPWVLSTNPLILAVKEKLKKKFDIGLDASRLCAPDGGLRGVPRMLAGDLARGVGGWLCGGLCGEESESAEKEVVDLGLWWE